MCGRYTLTYRDLGQVAELIGALVAPAAAELQRPRYNIAPTQPCIVAMPGELRPVLAPARWGVRLSGKLLVNARSETAAKRFPAAWARGRCVVPADGFYEWTGAGGARGDRRPIWFHAADAGPLLMAGLLFEPPGDGPAEPPVFTVLTTAARPPVAEIHERMPLLFTPEVARRWLAERPAMLPADAVALVGTAVSDRVNSVANDDAACLAAPGPEKGQLALF
jgi:putative SOS response-associated peptidase YedK